MRSSSALLIGASGNVGRIATQVRHSYSYQLVVYMYFDAYTIVMYKSQYGNNSIVYHRFI